MGYYTGNDRCSLPPELWTIVYTDDSVTKTTQDGGAGVLINQITAGRTEMVCVPTGQNCTNYKTEEEAILQATKLRCTRRLFQSCDLNGCSLSAATN